MSNTTHDTQIAEATQAIAEMEQILSGPCSDSTRAALVDALARVKRERDRLVAAQGLTHE